MRFIRFIGRYWRLFLIIPFILIMIMGILDQLFPLPVAKDEVAHVILAEDGTPLWRFADRKGVWRYPITIQQVSPDYIQALLAYEDRWFYKHPGVNLAAIGRAFTQNIFSEKIISGGSTLSMQVARLMDPHSKTYWGKVKQIFRTMQLELHYSKDQILTFYLNRAPYGGTIEGIAAASWSYLGKPPDQLTRAEAALLVVLPQAPSRLRPDRYPERAKIARDKVLDRLAEYHVWPQKEIDEIKQEQIFLPERKEPRIAALLAQRLYSAYPKDTIIHSTINANLQQHLEILLMSWQTRLPQHTSAAILVVDHQTMEVKAYLGSVDVHNDKRFGYVDMVSAIRSPGSTLKPFLYGLAMDDGLIHSESLLQDVPRRYGDYKPGNFSADFTGPVSVSVALATSLNLPAVQVLEVYGPKKFYSELTGAGIRLKLPMEVSPNLSVILGGVGTSLENLVKGYSAFARQGQVAQLRFRSSDPLVEKPLLSAGSAWIIRHILLGDVPTEVDHPVTLSDTSSIAIKTGTSYGFRDAWAIGVGPRYLIGVWIGRPDGTPVAGQYGVASAIPLLLQVHDITINQNNANRASLSESSKPSSVSASRICWPFGQKLPKKDPNCRVEKIAWILDGLTPPTLQAADQPLWMGIRQKIWVNQKGLQVAADCPKAQEKKIDLWPAPLEPWLPVTERRTRILPANDGACPPLSLVKSSPLYIVGVKDGDELRRPATSKVPLTLRLSSLGGNGKRWWFLNGEFIQETSPSQSFNKVFKAQGSQQLVALDESGQTAIVHFSVY